MAQSPQLELLQPQLQVRMLTGYAQPFNFQFPTGPSRFEQRQSLGLTKVEHVALHLAMAAFESGEDWNAGDLAAKAVELLDACDAAAAGE